MIEGIYEVMPEKFNEALKSYLKSTNEVVPLQDHDIMKTGEGREQAPIEEDWYFTRMASIVRQISIKGAVTSEFLAKRYGSLKNRGCRPSKYVGAYPEIGESVLENLKNMGWINEHPKDMLTEKGKTIVREIIEKVRE
ncbi:40S RIBOSOMAL PROTEIN S19 [Encephalitozoon cuniculi GB-M1]|uniref:Small ribosomal subunit protein eS19 n=2 Tax=Encephalitozoon cuniculi TaxID=6035 RepID=RS19_ENCCU|nr:40S ribosomal protein S19 [Encephalitozoon cuniculi GB-M1]Q8SQS8.1 RecName: Full=Small ribosomal subunit protein eS19; AltName: Full=40S ribosomal protein S19 [Encephalitozoon cuniculi GB-M1]7QEP_C9 Chain C9, 40S ribosomal protein S19 [Encephalitozoon cuniculi GB-M1]AGE94993.1 40S ribosomal protein S19 [Encephalitozoon cuniculi]KMV65120.1 40S ribosomal protein S19 [Encephalitozoon cuniculi EcunIII-L]UYI26369.1 ribosomal protein S19 [Encephalitozoon cuniculi]CAD26072.1 40S RIBOSOMAL PROTEIN